MVRKRSEVQFLLAAPPQKLWNNDYDDMWGHPHGFSRLVEESGTVVWDIFNQIRHDMRDFTHGKFVELYRE